MKELARFNIATEDNKKVGTISLRRNGAVFGKDFTIPRSPFRRAGRINLKKQSPVDFENYLRESYREDNMTVVRVTC